MATESVVVYDDTRKFLAEIDLDSGYRVRLVNFLGRPYMLSQDISALIPMYAEQITRLLVQPPQLINFPLGSREGTCSG